MAKDIYGLSLRDVIPSSIAGDPQIQAMIDALDPELQGVSSETREALIYSRIDELPENVIDLLAWQWHVDFYEPELLPVEMKRSLVKNSIPRHSKKGTLWAVKQILRDLGLEPTVREWFEINGAEPYTFAIEAVRKGDPSNLLTYLGGDTEKLIKLAVEVTKPARAHMLYMALLPDPPDIVLEHGYNLCFYDKCLHSCSWWPLPIPCLIDGGTTLPEPFVIGALRDFSLSGIAYSLAPAYGAFFYDGPLYFRLLGMGRETDIGFIDRRFARYRDWRGRWVRRKWTDRELYWEPSPLCKFWSFAFSQGVYDDGEPMGSLNCAYAPGYWIYPNPPAYDDARHDDIYPAPYCVPIDRYYDERFYMFVATDFTASGFGETELFARTKYERLGWGGLWGGKWGLVAFPCSDIEMDGFYTRDSYGPKAWGGPWRGKWGFVESEYPDIGEDLELACDRYASTPWCGVWEGHWGIIDLEYPDVGKDLTLVVEHYAKKPWSGPWGGYWNLAEPGYVAIGEDFTLAGGHYDLKAWGGPWRDKWGFVESEYPDIGEDLELACDRYAKKAWGGLWSGRWGFVEFPSRYLEAEGLYARAMRENKGWGGAWGGLWSVGEMLCSENGWDETFARDAYKNTPWSGLWVGRWGFAKIPAPDIETELFPGKCIYERKVWNGSWGGSWTVGELPSLENSQEKTLSRVLYEHKSWVGPWKGPWTIDEIPCSESIRDESLAGIVYEYTDWIGLHIETEGFFSRGVYERDDWESYWKGEDEFSLVGRAEGEGWNKPWAGQDESLLRAERKSDACDAPLTGRDKFLSCEGWVRRGWDGIWRGLWVVEGRLIDPILIIDEY
ncbi:MAG: phage tail protein I [Synergistaceae bacterium]|jgi:phage tail P2-like protein|nr:phage tail protein I [Synergistaceae bacterium]